MSTTIPDLDPTTERQLAAGLFNDTWRLLELPDRTAAQNDEMIHTAHASRWHWARIGHTANLARGEWMCARVYSEIGRAEPALWHASRCLAILEGLRPGEQGMEDFDLAGAFEGMARACLVAGDREGAASWIARARTALDDIHEPDDRKQIEADIDSLAL